MYRTKYTWANQAKGTKHTIEEVEETLVQTQMEILLHSHSI
jgi:hypothetical protein